MNVLKSIIIAFSMYSKVPMPQISWDKQYMKYAICFFPLVGVVMGLASTGMFFLGNLLNMGVVLKSVMLAILPIIITGGIHIDGFMDTMDAFSSFQSRQRKLEILSDPHIGAFCVISLVVYMMVMVGFFSEIVSAKSIYIISICYVLSRGLSGLGAVSFKNAKKEGLLHTFTSDSDTKIGKGILVFFIIVPLVLIFCIDVLIGAVILIASALLFAFYKGQAYKEFGGITGDLAGCYLSFNELMYVIIVAVFEMVGGFI